MEPEDPYGTSKVLGEETAKIVTRKLDVPVVSLRISNVQYPSNYTVVESKENLSNGVGNFWSYIDGRDMTTAIECTVDADIVRYEVFITAAVENYLGRPTTETFRETFGGLPDRCDLLDDQSALSNWKAKDKLG